MRGPIRIDADFRNDQIETLAVRIGSTQVLFLSNGTFIQSNTPTVGEGGVFSPVTVVQTDSEISLNGGNGSIVVTRRYGDNPSISITLPRGMLRSGMCGLCGNEEGMLAFRSTFPLRANFSEADLTRFIKSWKVDFEEGLFPVDPLDTECGEYSRQDFWLMHIRGIQVLHACHGQVPLDSLSLSPSLSVSPSLSPSPSPSLFLSLFLRSYDEK